MKNINIVHLYAREMNIYGDNGNVLVLKKRLEWRGHEVKVTKVGIGTKLPKNTHIIVGGGGQDAGQSKIATDLQKKSTDLKKLADNGVPMLMICGMYQMFGHYFKTNDGEKIKGIGLLDITTKAGKGRLIGNVVSRSKWGELVGYENHSGLTTLGSNSVDFGVVKYGQGNNGKDNTEGAYYKNVFGSYLHGPLLAKSPHFADHLLQCTLDVAGKFEVLKSLDDTLENKASILAAKRPR